MISSDTISYLRPADDALHGDGEQDLSSELASRGRHGN